LDLEDEKERKISTRISTVFEKNLLGLRLNFIKNKKESTYYINSLAIEYEENAC
jgi:hypothetical protein